MKRNIGLMWLLVIITVVTIGLGGGLHQSNTASTPISKEKSKKISFCSPLMLLTEHL